MDQAATLDSLHHGVLTQILAHCSPSECERFGTLNKTFLVASRAPQMWQRWAMRDFFTGEHEPVGPGGQQHASWRELYSVWAVRLAGLSLARCQVALRFWRDVRGWATESFPILLDTLNPGLSRTDLKAYEAWFGHCLPDELAALYIVHNGQHDVRPGHGFTARQRCAFTAPGPVGPILAQATPRDFAALFGHYSFYDHCVASFFLPLESALGMSSTNRAGIPVPALALSANNCPEAVARAAAGNRQRRRAWPGLLGITASPEPFGSKTTWLSCVTGEVLAETGAGHMMGLVSEGDPAQHLTTWLQTYASRLTSGIYSVKPVHHTYQRDSDPQGAAPVVDGVSHLTAINLYPGGAIQQTVDTCGIQVKTSAILIPEGSQPETHLFSYEVTFAHALKQGDQVPHGVVQDAQLVSRHWTVLDAEDNTLDEISGPGAVGLHPHLYPGCPEVPYRSCTYAHVFGHRMKGHFKFNASNVRGALATTGRPVEAACPVLTFDLPKCSY